MSEFAYYMLGYLAGTLVTLAITWEFEQRRRINEKIFIIFVKVAN